MPLKSYDVSLKFRLDVEELTDDLVRKVAKQFSNYNEIINGREWWEAAKSQRNLLHALLADNTNLMKFLRLNVLQTIDAEFSELLRSKFDFSDDLTEEILLSLAQKLEKKEIEYFIEAIKSETLSEHTAEFHECFQLNLSDLSITEVAAKDS